MKSTRSQATENLIHVLQAPESVAAHEDETLTYTIKDLLVSTAYRAAVACTEESGIQSDWSAEVSGRTLDRGTGGHLIRRQTLCVFPDPTMSFNVHSALPASRGVLPSGEKRLWISSPSSHVEGTSETLFTGVSRTIDFLGISLKKESN